MGVLNEKRCKTILQMSKKYVNICSFQRNMSKKYVKEIRKKLQNKI